MPSETQAIPFEEFVQQLETIFDESETQGSANVLVERRGTIFSVRAARRARRRGTSKPRAVAPQSPPLDLIGIWQSAEPTDIGLHKHDYLAEAAADLHETNSTSIEQHPNGQNAGSKHERSGDR